MNLRREIKPDELKRLYVDDGLTIEEIATRFRCGATTIRRRLDDLGLATRPRGSHPDPHANPARREWSPNLAYAVGLITTDGNLSKDGRHIAMVSADRDLLETFRACLNLDNRITRHISGSLRMHHRVQWGDHQFYNWLLSIGLVPAKSLRLGTLKIPDAYFADFVRGCLDGDGSIAVFTDRYNTFKNEKYVYERLYMQFTSASLPFLEWLHASIGRMVNVRGSIIARKPQPGHSPYWNLKFAQHDSIRLLQWLYYAPDVPCLARKRDKGLFFLRKADTREEK